MATNNKKTRNSLKDSDKKSSKKTEEYIMFEENNEEHILEHTEQALSPDVDSNEPQVDPPVEVDVVIEEPILTLLIVER